MRGTLRNADTGKILAADSRLAAGFRERLIGWIGRKVIRPEQALGIPNCDWVHTFGVCLPLDIVYCDREGRVLQVAENLPPNRIAPRATGAFIAWEMSAGGFSGQVREGQRLILEALPKTNPQSDAQNV